MSWFCGTKACAWGLNLAPQVWPLLREPVCVAATAKKLRSVSKAPGGTITEAPTIAARNAQKVATGGSGDSGRGTSSFAWWTSTTGTALPRQGTTG